MEIQQVRATGICVLEQGTGFVKLSDLHLSFSYVI